MPAAEQQAGRGPSTRMYFLFPVAIPSAVFADC